MKRILAKIAFGLTIAALSIEPLQACWNNAEQDAVKIKHLNTMLMVTALRCRGGPDNFLPQYNRFVTNNSALIGMQNNLIRSYLVQSVGQKGAGDALDRMSIGFANSYGTGHRTMDCRQLMQFASDLLSEKQDIATLTIAADQVVDETYLPGGVCAIQIASRR